MFTENLFRETSTQFDHSRLYVSELCSCRFLLVVKHLTNRKDFLPQFQRVFSSLGTPCTVFVFLEHTFCNVLSLLHLLFECLHLLSLFFVEVEEELERHLYLSSRFISILENGFY